MSWLTERRDYGDKSRLLYHNPSPHTLTPGRVTPWSLTKPLGLGSKEESGEEDGARGRWRGLGSELTLGLDLHARSGQIGSYI
jgi:hypothetical protein